MKKLLFVPIVLLLHFHSAAQDIKIYFHNIGYQAVIGTSSVFIQIAVTSTNPIASVTADIEGRDTALVYNEATTFYEGTISLTGLVSPDTVTLKITATDVLNNQQTASQPIIYDLRPVITLISPLNESVARPKITVKAKVDYYDSCILWIKFNTSQEIYLYKGKIKDSGEVTLDLSAYDGTVGILYVTIADRRGRGVNLALQNIYVESSPLLSEVYAADTLIMDFNYNKIFVRRDSSNHPTIIDIGTNERAEIPIDGDVDRNAVITPFGAIFNIDTDISPYYSIHEFNRGNLYDLGKTYASYFKTCGNYALWLDNVDFTSRVFFRDLSTLSTTKMPTDEVNSGDIAANGVMAYSAGLYAQKVFKYQNNNIVKLDDPSDNTSMYEPVTDGNYIVYTKADTHPSIYFYDGQSYTALGDIPYSSYYKTYPYLANNKFIAYSKSDSLFKSQAWLRDSLGNIKQQTFFKNGCGIEFLNADGDMMLKSNRRYLVLKSGETFEIGSSQFGTPYYRDSSWYISIGRMLYKINPSHVLPVKLLSFTAQKQGIGNLLKWSVAEDNNCNYIAIERSTDARSFYSIGKINVTSHGTLINYSYTDNNPAATINYYRLKIVDKDASFQYSEIKKVDNSVNFSAVISPNPAKASVDLKISSIGSFTGFIDIIDMNGRLIQSQKKLISSGISIHNFNITSLDKGIYYMRIKNGSNYVSLKFVKL